MYKLLFTSEFSLEKEQKEFKFKNALENYIVNLNRELFLGKLSVSDNTYNNCMTLLEMVYPDSVLLKSEKNVKLVTEMTEDLVDCLYEKLEGETRVVFAVNPQGLNLRLFYNDGELVKALTFGRTFPNRDVTDIAIRVLSNRNENMADLGEVEVDGVLVLMKDQLDYVSGLCKSENCYDSLFALLNYDKEHNGSVDNIEEIITFIATDIKIEGLPLETAESKFSFLEEELFFETPHKIEYDIDGLEKDDFMFFFQNVLNETNVSALKLNYNIDAYRLLIEGEDVLLFRGGTLEFDVFTGRVLDIEWREEKGVVLPVIIFEKPIRVEDNLKLTEFVLNNVALLLVLNIDIGEEVRFVYIGDFGVLPIIDENKIILNV